MAQVGIVRIGTAFFREYAIESGDSLIGICLRFGHTNWRAVYDHVVNAPFRARFPDPDAIDFVNPVNLFIPLVGSPRGGIRRRAAPIGDYIVARIRDEEGNRLAGVSLRQIMPGAPHAGSVVTTDSGGDIIISNPVPGDWFLSSPDYELVATASPGTATPVQDWMSVRHSGSLPDPTPDFQLTRNSVIEITARRIYYIVCPECGRTFRTIKTAPTGPHNLCPNDSFDLSSIESEIVANSTSFTAPTTGQNPATSPTTLRCRGTSSLSTAHGPATIYWDESRFARSNGTDYTLFAWVGVATPRSVHIVGRSTWGAVAPVTGGRSYEFHATALHASLAYSALAIPSNETQSLSGVLKWMTIHHTTDDALNSYGTATALQHKHQTTGEDGSPYADIAYHYVIDANGAIYEGRPLGIKGAHTQLFNGGNIGIVVAGDFESRLANGFTPDIPTPAALIALTNLILVLAFRFNVQSVWSHRMRAPQAGLPADHTECPGDNLQGFVEGALRTQFHGPPP